MSNQDQSGQLQLNLQVVTANANGTDMEIGVLSDTTPFMTGRGLSGVCGISNSTLINCGEYAPERDTSGRDGILAELLDAWGFDGDRLFVRILHDNQTISAYPYKVCLAFLEYYAYRAGRNCNEVAKINFRKLAGDKLKEFIYEKTGYKPSVSPISAAWQNFHDRQLLNSVPAGYFSIFRQTSDIVLSAIQHGLIVDDHTVPDISMGMAWNNYWKANNLTEQYGKPTRYPHIYPDYFPQAKANSSIDAWIYPCKALGVFVDWLQTEYLPYKFPNYLHKKVKTGAISAARVQSLLKAVTPISLPQEEA